jgi:general secretion pathway protein D
MIGVKVAILALTISQSIVETGRTPQGEHGLDRLKAPGTWVAQRGIAGTINNADIDYDERMRKGKFSFEFSKAEIGDIVKAISDMTRRNFIIPDNLKSKRVTILSPTKITAYEAYRVFLSALAANSITIVRLGKFYKLVPSREASKTVVPTCLAGDRTCPKTLDQIITQVIHLKYIEANQVNSVIKGLASKDAQLSIFQPSNAIILSEYAPNIVRIRRIVDSLDQPGFDDELQLVQIMHATASEIASKLKEIFDIRATGQKQPRSKAKGSGGVNGAIDDSDDAVQISKILADDRTNQLIIKANRRSFRALEKLINSLDVPIAGEGSVHVHYLENADAEELASTLSSLAQNKGGSSKRGARASGKKGAAGKKGVTSAVLFEGEIRITADKSTNALIIVASGEDYRAMRRLIEKLDVPRTQVYVEAAILEVTVSNKNERSIDWHTPFSASGSGIGGIDSNDGGAGNIGFLQSSSSTGGLSPTLGALLSPESLVSVAGGSLAGLVGQGVSVPVGDSTLTLPAFGVLLKWLETSSAANILSTPHILTTDNEEASIEVGQKIPFRRGTSIPGGAGGLGGLASGGLGGLGSLFSSTDRIDVSLKLTLTPHVNERNKVRIDIDQQIEDVSGIDESTGQPITSKRSAKTVVVVDDQQSVVIGGLIRDRVSEGESKIPILGDLPLIGWLFRQHTRDVEKVNLLLVLTPYVIRTRADFQRIFERKVREHENFAKEYYGHLKKYRAHIDYTKKIGPIGQLGKTVQSELSRIENGGQGLDSVLVSPEGDDVPTAATSGEKGQEAVQSMDPTEGLPLESEKRKPVVPSEPAGSTQEDLKP